MIVLGEASIYQPTQVVSTTEEIREALGELLYSQDIKCINHIDEHCRTQRRPARPWVELCNLVVAAIN